MVTRLARERRAPRAGPGRRVQGAGRRWRARRRRRGVAELVKARKLPLLVSVNFDPPRPRRPSAAATSEKERREIEEAERNPAELHKAGVAFALVSGLRARLPGRRAQGDRARPARGGGPARDHARAGGSAGRGRPAGQPGGGQDRERRGVVGRAAGQGHEGRRWCSSTARSTSRTEQPDAKPRTRRHADEPRRRRRRTVTRLVRPSRPARRAAQPPPPPHAAARRRSLAICGGTILTVGPQGTIANGTVLIRDGKIAAVGTDVRGSRGRARDRRRRPLRDARHHRRPLPHRHRGRASTSARTSVTAEVRIADVLDQRRRQHLPAARGRRHRRQRAARLLQRDRRPERGHQDALGQAGRSELVFAGAPRGIKFALGENPKRSNFRVPGSSAATRARAWASRSCSATRSARRAGLQARVGRVRAEAQGGAAPASAPVAPAPRPAAGDAARHPRRQGATCTRTATAPTRS